MILDFFRRLHGLVSDDGIRVYAPVSGKILPIEDVPDVVFSERIAGDGIAIKPGKPTILGKCGEKPIVGLPGHPVAAYFITKLFP